MIVSKYTLFLYDEWKIVFIIVKRYTESTNAKYKNTSRNKTVKFRPSSRERNQKLLQSGIKNNPGLIIQ